MAKRRSYRKTRSKYTGVRRRAYKKTSRKWRQREINGYWAEDY